MSVISFGGAAAFYGKWHNFNGSAQMAGAGLLFALLALFRRLALNRKRLELERARLAYKAMLIKPFL